jgi:acetyl esterase
LTAAILVLAKQRNTLENSIKYQILYYPVTDDTMSSGSYQKFGVGYYLTRSFTEFFYNNYKPEVTDNTLFAPAKATVEDVTGLPPVLLMTAEADVLRDGKLI